MGSENHPVREILQAVLRNSEITPNEVKQLEDFVKQDWVIDAAEAEFLFQINQALGNDHAECTEWSTFFVKSVCRLVVLDLDSPGEIDNTEGDWLADMLEKYSASNESERKLIQSLKDTTQAIGGRLGQLLQSLS